MNTSVKFDKTKYKGVWKPNTYYDQTDMVFYNGALWLANVAFTSGATFDELNWTCPSCAEPLILDTVPDPQTAVAFVKLRSDYMGYCCKIRRESDDAEMDIGFIGDIVDVAAIESFRLGGHCYLSVWYDQSGNNNDWTETTLVNQHPITVSDSSSIIVNLVNGIPATIAVTGGYYNIQAPTLTVVNPVTGFMVAKNSQEKSAHLSSNDNTYVGLTQPGSGSSSSNNAGGGVLTYVNGVLDAVATRDSMYTNTYNVHAVTSFTNWDFTLFNSSQYSVKTDYSNTTYSAAGNIQAIIIYGRDESANRAIVESSLKSSFGI